MTLQKSQTPSLSDALALYFSDLKEGDKSEIQQELSKFVRWYGRDRFLSALTPPEVGKYADILAGSGTTPDAARRLDIIKNFLSFVKKEGLINQNLAQHARVRRGKYRSETIHPGEALSEIKLTSEGYAQLQADLKALKAARVRIAGEIRLAAADKDVRENAPLEAAREQQGHTEARIRELEATLKVAVVLSEDGKATDGLVARLGTRVTIKDTVTTREMTYRLVSPNESNPLEGKISVASPLGKALLDRFPRQEVEVMTPKGAHRYFIVGVSS